AGLRRVRGGGTRLLRVAMALLRASASPSALREIAFAAAIPEPGAARRVDGGGGPRLDRGVGSCGGGRARADAAMEPDRGIGPVRCAPGVPLERGAFAEHRIA